MATAFPQSLSIEDARAILLLCNSYSRLGRLVDMWLGLEIEALDWLRLLGEEWSCCDNIGLMAGDLLHETPFSDAIDDPALSALLMDEAERAALAALPDEITVYRGCYASNKWGLSWSLDRATAAKFPRLHRYRQDGQPLLVTAKMLKADVVALKLDRNEAEIVAPQGHVWGAKPPRKRLRHVSTSHIVAA